MTFISKPEQYGLNRRNARHTKAGVAYIAGPDRNEPAVCIFRGNFVLSLLPVADALRLSNQIVDAAEKHEVHA
ncbi:hypothetical protein [Arthrobacter sp. G119Y2]|uniref:hypothetical protein n=1 Tax=Arthrobacter sp. G119Y2 TaxID=3134965 RepID=UPI00311955AD